MLLNRSRIFLACTFASALVLSACGKPAESKKDDTLTATTPATAEASNITERNAQKRLINTLEAHFKTANINAKIKEVKPTEVPNLYWVSLDGMSPVYATSDGKFLIQGDVLRLGDKEITNVSDKIQAAENKKLLNALKIEDLLVYPAKGKAKHVVYIFTDASCPYCHKLHSHIPEMNNKGIEVRYIAWPRGEQFMPTMESVWCSPNRQVAFEKAVAGEAIAPAQCKNPVRDQYQLGLNMGVNGTPAIYNTEGEHIGAYMTADELLKRLEK